MGEGEFGEKLIIIIHVITVVIKWSIHSLNNHTTIVQHIGCALMDNGRGKV